MPIVLGSLYAGGWYFAIVVLAVASIAQWEMYGLFESAGIKAFVPAGMILGACVILRGMISIQTEHLVAFGALAVMVIEMYRSTDFQLVRVAATFTGIFYPAYLAGYFIELRNGTDLPLTDSSGFYLMLMVFLLVTATDTSAYYTGKSFGKHKLFPRISPAKTWEGAAGGLAAAVIVAVALKVWLVSFLTWQDVIVTAVLCGVGGPYGDLVESMFKRSVGVKDTGSILPGHGGFLDRIDALLFATPLVYFYFRYIAFSA